MSRGREGETRPERAARERAAEGLQASERHLGPLILSGNELQVLR